MEQVRQTALFCVGRAVFFGSFAISIVMLSFAFDIVLVFRAGALMTFGLAVVLLWYAQTAASRRPSRTETWLLLAEDKRPHNEHAERAFCETMRQVYTFYASYAAMFGTLFLLTSLILGLFGVDVGLRLDSR